ncbi:MAG: hypothetical protein EKK55_17305 [Rhodocyclaceae bacterium]|nr:MAG: hypothetical protein EKK55_17305 [Rhodocyclaceae bacterium]
MAWIESHEEIGDHSKTQKLAELLGCGVNTAVGIVHLLWHYTLKVSWQFGDLSKQNAKAIARACWWDDHHDHLLSSLIEAGFIEKSMKVHDWEVYAKELIYQRLYNSKRKDRKNTAVHTAVSTPVVKGSTLPNLTKPNTLATKFEEVWAKYPRREGKKQAKRHFDATVKTDGDLADIRRAMGHYLESKTVKDGFIQKGATWFNNWQDWVDYKGAPEKNSDKSAPLKDLGDPEVRKAIFKIQGIQEDL